MLLKIVSQWDDLDECDITSMMLAIVSKQFANSNVVQGFRSHDKQVKKLRQNCAIQLMLESRDRGDKQANAYEQQPANLRGSS